MEQAQFVHPSGGMSVSTYAYTVCQIKLTKDGNVLLREMVSQTCVDLDVMN